MTDKYFNMDYDVPPEFDEPSDDPDVMFDKFEDDVEEPKDDVEEPMEVEEEPYDDGGWSGDGSGTDDLGDLMAYGDEGYYDGTEDYCYEGPEEY